MTSTPLTRTCRGCGETKPFEDFTVARNCRWGRSFKCKTCTAAIAQAWRDAGNVESRDHGKHRAARVQRFLSDAAKTCECDALKRGAVPGEFVVPLVVLEEADGVCAICGEDVDPFDFSLDHIVPCRDGGTHSYANVQLAHPSCNTTRSNNMKAAQAA